MGTGADARDNPVGTTDQGELSRRRKRANCCERSEDGYRLDGYVGYANDVHAITPIWKTG